MSIMLGSFVRGVIDPMMGLTMCVPLFWLELSPNTILSPLQYIDSTTDRLIESY